jgi:secondary thiamine-phosphate synthase enzyme
MIITKDIKTGKHEELIEITQIISDEILKNNFIDGRVLVFVPHTTAGITINENADPDVRHDIIYGLKGIGLEALHFNHSEGNSPAHIKSSLTGCSLDLIVSNGKLLLGTWQGIYFCEFDGPRSRKFIIQF